MALSLLLSSLSSPLFAREDLFLGRGYLFPMTVLGQNKIHISSPAEIGGKGGRSRANLIKRGQPLQTNVGTRERMKENG